MRPLRAGWHRLLARDGQRAVMLVADDGRIVEFMGVDRVDPPSRPSRKFLGTVEEVRVRAERAELERQIRIMEAMSEARARVVSEPWTVRSSRSPSRRPNDG